MLIAVICCIMPKIYAQTIVEKTFDFKQKRRVMLDLQITDSIDIQTWNKSEVYAYASININNNKDNDAYQTSFKELDDKLEITSGFKEDYFKNCQCNNSSQIIWKVMIPENSELSVKTINGNIIIKGKTAAVDIHSISGFIDMGIGADKGADLSLKTISGNIYTDVNFSGKISKDVVEVKILKKLNGGGVAINLETISGDIFLRKY